MTSPATPPLHDGGAWQCSSCGRVFLRAWLPVCLVCGARDHWTGSVYPADLAAAHALEAAADLGAELETLRERAAVVAGLLEEAAVALAERYQRDHVPGTRAWMLGDTREAANRVGAQADMLKGSP